MIVFEHQKMGSYKSVDFSTSLIGLSVAIKEVDDNFTILKTEEKLEKWLSSCSAIILINSKDNKAALFHYPAGKLKNNQTDIDVSCDEMIMGIGGIGKIDEVFIYRKSTDTFIS